jgi:hypothetical protein
VRTYRASSLGGCTRAQVAGQLDYPELAPPEKFENEAGTGYFQRGNAHEEECLVAMEADGWPLTTALPGTILNDKYGKNQMYQEWQVAGAEFHLRFDGGLSGPFRVLEIKSPKSWAKWEKAHKTGDYSDPLMHRYAYQISCYMVATGLEAVIACVEDGRVKTFGIEVPPFDLAAITERVAGMEAQVEAGKLPSVCSQKDYPCAFAALCRHEEPEFVEDAPLDALVLNYQDWVTKEKEAKAGKDQARTMIEGYLGEHKSLETASAKVTRVSTRRGTIQKDLLVDLGVDVEAVTKYTVTESLRITQKGESDA